ncbi:UNVERIFIED_CONTAM: hypothetical protein Sindi_2275700 [Sesamum indicum]
MDAASGGALYDKTPTEARKLITTMAANNQQFGIQQVKTCGIYTFSGHCTDACPTLHEESTEHADAIDGFFGQQQRRYDPFFNTYNSGWRDLPNLRYREDTRLEHPTIPIRNPLEHTKFGIPNEPTGLIRQPFGVSSGKELQLENSTRREYTQQDKIEDALKILPKQVEKPNQVSEESPKVFVPKPSFLERFAKSKEEEEE